MRTHKIALVLAALMVGGVAMTLLPTATAQQSASITVSLNPPSESVKPLQGPISFTGTISFTADYTGVTGIIGIPVTYQITKQPAWANVLVSPATDVFPAPTGPSAGTSYTVTKQITVTVTASDQAPAFQAEQIEVTATTTPSQQGKAAVGKGQVPITAAYFSILDVQLAEAIKIERPQTAVIFPVKISNFGNANTKVTFSIAEGTDKKLQVPVPNPITLQSKQAGGNQISADVPLTVQTPYKNGYMNEVGVVNFNINSAYALDSKITGDDSSVALLVTTRGFYVPGVSPIFLLGLVGAIALAVRRFRE